MSDLANLESKMFRWLEIKREQKRLKEEKEKIEASIMRVFQESKMNYHSAKLDEDHDLVATITEKDRKIFEKETMATDLGVTPSATQKKDFLINMTEKGKLTLKKFKTYFSYETDTTLSIKQVKLKKKRDR